jgi:TolB protein
MERITVLALAAVLIAGTPGIATPEQCELSTIAFTSTRDFPNAPLAFGSSEIYLMNPDGTDPRRLTENTEGDALPKLSPDGKRIVFDSNRARGAGEPANTSDLFLMKADGKNQTLLTRGSSATWSPDGKHIAFHRSSSGGPCPVSSPPPFPGIPGCPIKTDPGAATWDSDIFIMRVPDDDEPGEEPINLTNSPNQIDDDPDWSPDGQKIVFTSHPDTDNVNNSIHAEIYVLDLATGQTKRLTFNLEEERAPTWSPDGKQIAYLCRAGGADFEICVMNADDGTGQTALTNNLVLDATPAWSPDGQKIVFHRNVAGLGSAQLFVMKADGTDQTQLTGLDPSIPGLNLLASWGVVRAKCGNDN